MEAKIMLLLLLKYFSELGPMVWKVSGTETTVNYG